MSERLDILQKARDRMLEERDAHAKVLASFETDMDPSKIDLRKTYTDEFALAAKTMHK